jgi:hypothetical protein
MYSVQIELDAEVSERLLRGRYLLNADEYVIQLQRNHALCRAN